MNKFKKNRFSRKIFFYKGLVHAVNKLKSFNPFKGCRHYRKCRKCKDGTYHIEFKCAPILNKLIFE